MCLGIPMQVTGLDTDSAWCEGRGERLKVDTRLVERPRPGDWLLVFHGVARETLSKQRAADITSALEALDAALRGETNLDSHFADLVDREPQLPEHLRKEIGRA